jgi:prepilin-type N-terminal cleavage/methylation domain-containing protein
MIMAGATSGRLRSRGMTLIEMLVAMTMTLIIMGVVAQLFGMMGKGLTGSRNSLDLDAQLRSVAFTLRNDLAGITALPIPPLSPEADAGYLEIIEGPRTDLPAGGGSLNTLTGDWDDVLMFTTRSFGDAFTGRCEPAVFGGSSTIRSQHAEVAWFCRESPSQQQIVPGTTLYTLYRRQLLVIPYVGLGNFASGGNSVTGSLPDFQYANDLSVHVRPDGRLGPNSLGDLTKRENRFLHNPTGNVLFPFEPFTKFTNNQLNGHIPEDRDRVGEDVVIANVIAFDVRVFDPREPLPLLADGLGAYVDLGSLPGANPQLMTTAFPPPAGRIFRTRGVRVSNAPNNRELTYPTYDTWSTHYESNGRNEADDSRPDLADQGMNLQDDNGDGLVDDLAERETSPPYPVPLRGIEVRIRCYEPSSRQVRQVTVRHTFVPH